MREPLFWDSESPMDSGVLTLRKRVVQASHQAAHVSPSAWGGGGVRVVVSGHFDSMSAPSYALSPVSSAFGFSIFKRGSAQIFDRQSRKQVYPETMAFFKAPNGQSNQMSAARRVDNAGRFSTEGN